MNLRHVHDRWTRFSATPRGKRTIKAVRTLVVTLIVGLLIYQLTKIGWQRILGSLPTQPLFYLLVLGMYFLLPVTESLIYGRLWSLHPLQGVWVMIRKRVLNVDVVGYSGEIYLFLWAKGRVAEAPRRIMGVIKDNLIVSSASSLLAAGLLIGGLLAAGVLDLEAILPSPSMIQIGLGVFAAVLLPLAFYRFRRVIFSLSRRLLAFLALAHVSRFLIGYVLQVAAWWVVIPSASFQTWAILLVLFVVINRIPFMPSSDLVFVSAGAGIAPMLDVPLAPVVSMLLVRSAVDRVLNLILFVTSARFDPVADSSQADEELAQSLNEARRGTAEARAAEPSNV